MFYFILQVIKTEHENNIKNTQNRNPRAEAGKRCAALAQPAVWQLGGSLFFAIFTWFDQLWGNVACRREERNTGLTKALTFFIIYVFLSLYFYSGLLVWWVIWILFFKGYFYWKNKKNVILQLQAILLILCSPWLTVLNSTGLHKKLVLGNKNFP